MMKYLIHQKVWEEVWCVPIQIKFFQAVATPYRSSAQRLQQLLTHKMLTCFIHWSLSVLPLHFPLKEYKIRTSFSCLYWISKKVNNFRYEAYNNYYYLKCLKNVFNSVNNQWLESNKWVSGFVLLVKSTTASKMNASNTVLTWKCTEKNILKISGPCRHKLKTCTLKSLLKREKQSKKQILTDGVIASARFPFTQKINWSTLSQETQVYSKRWDKKTFLSCEVKRIEGLC